MNRFLPILLLILLFVAPKKADSQIDTLFWFAAPWTTPDHTGIAPVAFHFSTFANPTTIRIQQPASSYDTTFIVPANSLFTKYVDFMLNLVESKPANTVLQTGFKITSDYPITVVYDIITVAPTHYNPETYSLKGQNGMGTEFVLPFQTLWRNRPATSDVNGDGVITQPHQQFSIVATEDNTTIYITPKTDIVGHPAGVTFSVTLPNKGDVWTGQNIHQNLGDPGMNLSGTIVVSNKPVSITVSDDSVQPYPAGSCADEMGDQIVPVNVVGKEYIVNKGFLNTNVLESFFIVATENYTTVTINDGTTSTIMLNQGDSYAYNITQPLTHVLSDKPVYVFHMSGYGCELGAAILPPLNCAGSDQVSFPRTNDQSFLLNIMCPTGEEGAFVLNGSTTLVPASAFSPVPGTSGAWMGAQISYSTADIPSGSANFLKNTVGNFSLGIINGGSTSGCLYHYMSSFLRKVYTDAGNDTTMCNSVTTIPLKGTVKGGVNTGIWQVLNGSGTMNTPTNLTTSYTIAPSDITQGSLTFVLTSTGNCNPVSDTMKVTFIQSPIVDAGLDNAYCKNNIDSIPINGTVSYAVGSTWTGGNGGSFENAGNHNTTYTPSPADLNQDSVVLVLTSAGSLYACPEDNDTLVLHFTDPPSVVAGPDQVICSNDASINLNGTVSGATNSGLWSTSGSGTFAPSQNELASTYQISNADTAVGEVVIYFTSTNNGNCLAVTDSLKVTILDKPSISILSQDSICSNLPSIELIGNVSPGFNATWNVGGSGGILDPTSLNTFYTMSPFDLDTNFIMIYLETGSMICPSVKDSMKVNLIEPPIVNAGTNQQLCMNQPIQLSGTISGPSSGGSWASTGTGNFSPSNNLLTTYYFPSASDVENGSVKLILSSNGDFGCAPSKDTITITFKPAPIAVFSATTACQGSNTIFQDASTTSDGAMNNWVWYFGDADSSVAQDPIHVYDGSGTYNVMLVAGSSNGCFDTIQKVVTVNPKPVAQFSPQNPCEGMPFVVTDQSFISSGSVVAWSYDFPDGTSSIEQNPEHTFANATSYDVHLTVTSDLGCTDDTLQTIVVNPAPDAGLTANPNPALVFEDVHFTGKSTGNTIQNWYWNFGDGEGTNIQNPIHNYSDGGYYHVYLTVTDVNGCVDSTSLKVGIGLKPALPSGFTPNGDGENDVFIIRGGPFLSIVFKVYNKWGQLIFNSTDQTKGWDGTYKGKPAPIGVYTWTYVVELANKKVEKKSGDVTLMR